jgi:putative addiction module component (TIGR02574 family)
MIIETLPDVQTLSKSDKEVLARELLDELNAPETSPSQDAAMLELLNQRYEAYISGEEATSSWKDVQARLKKWAEGPSVQSPGLQALGSKVHT